MLWFEAKPNGKWIAEWMKEKLGIKKKVIYFDWNALLLLLIKINNNLKLSGLLL